MKFPYTSRSLPPSSVFPERHLQHFPYLTIGLFKAPSALVKVKALIDTGAEYCFFNRGFGKMLGLDVESGNPMPLVGIGGNKEQNIAYIHEVEIICFKDDRQRLKDSYKYSAKVGFLKNEIATAGLLGENRTQYRLEPPYGRIVRLGNYGRGNLFCFDS